jgi:hypothetical protein
MKRSPKAARRMSPAVLLAVALTSALISPAAADGASQDSLNKAHNFLKTQKQGKEILNFLHFGADYLDHQYFAVKAFDDGSFALGYKFRWRTTEDGYTNVAFVCDADGNVQRVVILDTDAIINRPFAVANLSIKLLGQLLIDQYRDKLSDGDRRRLQQLVNDADAHALLEWSLKAEQFFGN